MKQSYKQLFSIFTIMLLTGQCAFAITTDGHLSPSHRRLSQQGMMELSIDGEGFFAYALRVKEPGTDGAADESMIAAATTEYNGAYGGTPGPANSAANAGQQTDGAVAAASSCVYTAPTAAAAATCKASDGSTTDACTTSTALKAAGVAAAAGDETECESLNDGLGASTTTTLADGDLTATGEVTVDAQTNGGANSGAGQFKAGDIVLIASCPALGEADTDTRLDGDYKVKSVANDVVTLMDMDGNDLSGISVVDEAGCTITKKKQGAENTEPEDGFYIQVVYSRDGSLHVNKYGFLVDDNGLLLLGAARGSDGMEEGADTVAKEAIHIPSRAEDIIVTNTGKVVVQEQAGSKFTPVGQVKLTRFANPMGLNIRLHMKSRCSSMNEIGFSLGNWCAGSVLDGKPHEYLAESEVSGPGEKGNPGDAGIGFIVQ